MSQSSKLTFNRMKIKELIIKLTSIREKFSISLGRKHTCRMADQNISSLHLPKHHGESDIPLWSSIETSAPCYTCYSEQTHRGDRLAHCGIYEIHWHFLMIDCNI